MPDELLTGVTAVTVKVPLQVAVLPAQLPELAETDMLLYVPAAGLLQFGAPVQARSLLTAPLQVTDGGVIAVPAVPDEGTLAQARVYVITLLLLGTTELLLGTTELLLGTFELLLDCATAELELIGIYALDEELSAELLLGETLELDGIALELLGSIDEELFAEPLLGTTLELDSIALELLVSLDEERTAELELGVTEELLGSSTELLLGSSGGLDGESFEQAKNVNTMAEIAASGKKRLVFIINS